MREERTLTTLLVVDDHEPTLDLIDRYFSGKGYKVYVYTNSESVRQLLTKVKIDVAIIDVRLEGYPQGLDILSQLKEQNRSTFFILITAHIPAARPGIMSLNDKARQLGADVLIEKSHDLCERIDKSIPERLSPRSITSTPDSESPETPGRVIRPTNELRGLLQRLDEVELDTLCLDHFPKVYDRFGRGLRRDEKLNLLLDHCRRNLQETERLNRLLKEE